ncbi:MAG: segregation/condensation protein A [Anaerolineaceae bacterium]|nr:segregation/condensation protein A [Anaerolineaceae bacterium]
MAGSWIHKTDHYEIDTEIYSGPLELLLDLIQKAELDISKLALAQVTDQFLGYVREHEQADPEYISEFLVIASKLVQIKSEAILPRPPAREPEEEDPGDALAHQLIIYREIKNATQWMQERVNLNLRTHLHVAQHYPVNVQFDLSEIELTDLILALENLAAQEQNQEDTAHELIPKMTLRKKVEEIVHFLRLKPHASFSELLNEQPTRLDMIVVFLAVLELVKQHYIKIKQEAIFSEIEIDADTEQIMQDEMEMVMED